MSRSVLGMLLVFLVPALGAAQEAPARLAVTTEPPGVGLALDGEPLEPAELSGRPLAPGRHTLQARDGCFTSEVQELLLQPGESRAVVLGAAPAWARLRVESADGRNRPVKGEVWADDEKRGETWEVLQVPLCARSLEVRTPSGARFPLPSWRLDPTRVNTRRVLAGLPPQDFLDMLAGDFSGGEAGVGDEPEATRRDRYQRACATGELAACLLKAAPALPLPSPVAVDGKGLLAACTSGQVSACEPAAQVLLKRDPLGARQAALLSCDEGRPSACGLLERLPPGQEGNRPSAFARVYASGCDEGSGASCLALGAMVGTGRGAVQDVGRASELFARACAVGDAVGCQLATFEVNEGPSPESMSRRAMLLEKSCAGGHPRGCLELGERHREGRGLPRDETRAAAAYRAACELGAMEGCAEWGKLSPGARGEALLQKACDRGEELGCAELAQRLLSAAEGGSERQRRATVLLEKGCDARGARSCMVLGALYARGTFGRRDPELASTLFDRACQRGRDTAACVELAAMHLSGAGVPRNEQAAGDFYVSACQGAGGRCADALEKLEFGTALSLRELGCKRKIAADCRALGERYEEGDRVPVDTARAGTFYKQACDLGDAWGCYQFGVMLDEGTGTAKNPTRAVGYLKRACDGKEMGGCIYLGTLHEDGRGVSKDEARAAALYKQACDAKNETGCMNLGILYAHGRGVAKDAARAAALYRQACDGGEGGGCHNLGWLYMDGTGVPKSAEKAAELFEQACEMDNLPACGSYGHMLRRGEGGLPQDDARGRELLEKACADGNEWSCEKLKDAP